MITGRDVRVLLEIAFEEFAAGAKACSDTPTYSEKELKTLYLAASANAWGITIGDFIVGMEMYHKACNKTSEGE